MHAEDLLKAEDEEAKKVGQDSGTFRHDKRSRRSYILETLVPMIERYRRLCSPSSWTLAGRSTYAD